MNQSLSVAAIWRLWLLCLGGYIAWLALAPQAPTRLVGARSAPAVNLPTPPAVLATSAALQELERSRLWGPRAASPASAAAAAEAAPSWFATGTYAVGAQRTLVVHFQDNARPAQQLRPGDRLPDGARLLAIEADRYQIRRAGKRVWQAVNRSAPLPDNPARGR